MKTLLFGLLLSAPSASVDALPGWVVTERVTIRHDGGATRTLTQTTEITSNAIARWTSESSNRLIVDASAPELQFIDVDRASGTYYGYDAATIAATDMGCPLMDGVAVSPEGLPVGLAQPFITTSRHERIEGRDLVEWQSAEKGPVGETVTLWVADTPDGLPNNAVTSVLHRVFSRPSSQWERYFAGLAAIHGYPMKTRMRIDRSGVTVEFVVVNITRAEIPAAHFRPPEGFRRVGEPLGFEGTAN